jgi:hypothetical protein
LLCKSRACFFGLDAPKRRKPYAQRANIASDENLFEGRGHNSACQFYASAVDLGHFIFQAMFGQFKAVGTKGIGQDDLRPGLDVSAVHIGYQ